MNTATSFPEHLQAACDEAIAAFKSAKPESKSLGAIKEWLEVDGWDALIADLGDQMAINLAALAYDQFTDGELRANLDIPDDQSVTDTDRLQWGREKIDEVVNNYDDCLLPSVHAYQLVSSNGDTAWIGCLVEIHGQLGPACQWQGLWPSREFFWMALGENNAYWLVTLMGDVPDEVILSLWPKPKRSRKRVTKKKPS
jgi:hypothetical protein